MMPSGNVHIGSWFKTSKGRKKAFQLPTIAKTKTAAKRLAEKQKSRSSKQKTTYQKWLSAGLSDAAPRFSISRTAATASAPSRTRSRGTTAS